MTRLPFAVALLAFACSAAPAADPCPWWRPCGPGDTSGGNRFIPQGAFGADARPACQKHDQCYTDAAGRRIDCDRAFLTDLRTACQSSRHPWLCNRLVGVGYLGVRLGGRSSFGEP